MTNRIMPRDARINPRRTIEFHAPSNAYIIRDKQSVVRAVLHTQKPVVIAAATATQAAQRYLRDHANWWGSDDSQLRNLHLPSQNDPEDIGVEYRSLSEKRQFDVTTVTFQQTCLALPVWQAAISVHLKHLPDHFECISAQTTRHDRLSRQLMPPPDAVMRLKSLDEQVLARQLGITGTDSPFDAGSLRIAHRQLMIYLYEAKKRAEALLETSDAPANINALAIPLQPVPDDIAEGSYNVVAAVYFDLTRTSRVTTHWVALVEARTHSVLYLEEFAAGVNGKVFLADPMTTHGGPPSNASNAKLNPRRERKVLPNLAPSNPQELIGSNVKVLNFDPPKISPGLDPPNKPSGADFEFDVRTNDFGAVNAYFNCDRFFGYVEGLGFNRADYFPGTTFPIKIDHRGTPPSGADSAGAQCRGVSRPDGTRRGIESVVFALAHPLINPPTGNACDWRVVLHELGGHGTLLNHVDSTRFLFAHSPGDSLAAILNAPESKARDKGRTYPWVSIMRRHDRKVADGWAWDGPRDIGDDASQLEQEQILSTTHFNLYKAIGGGNKQQVDTRHFAARYTAYLIFRAIYTLTPATNPPHASDWMHNLIAADSCDWTSEGHSGGAYEKVIYWVFQKQGLFGGNPPPVDVYIDDGRGGEYDHQPDHASCTAIWNRRKRDGKTRHQKPVPNAVNFAYVKIKNRGSQAATSVAVKAFQNTSQTSRTYPADWAPMQTPQLSRPNVPPKSAAVTVGPFEWIPSAGANSILMAVSADGDASNLGKFGANKPIPASRLVPHDNNLGMRKV